ncbi:PTS system cellobiose-specific IIC component [Caldanaerobacter subterraneus subsp. tengcongensis MB4]|uniref:Permease IIC component n=1 Tax=Caldanaerobacter subterraneus subsp. tengcongensis (strain DSM 15242 / JCM 11007 / NBRC 100824 / MB4) TaxID=273068 RepID=Q8RC46_CALS4|nr:PTS transporter subunit EIIC [Caldanaerobacter subterraneus]AAM23871.1 Phosphotransferase system cellobiose-specific component IIC [Caldanaerobacter subterraneus subsp. tengcongensis MB4]MCS3916624.1 PTS system cellobiose-specific IIC component [Caldanaerobacter subterraneus subsp. tengcongensis MB4]
MSDRISNNPFMKWMEESLMPVLARIAQNVYLQSIRDAFSSFALPVILTGALFLIIANPPEGINWAPIHAWAKAVKPIAAQIMIPFQLTFGIMAMMVAFGTAYSLAARWDLDETMTGIIALLAFFITSFPATDVTKVTFGDVLNYLGGQGLFVAIIIGILSAIVVRFFNRKGLVIKMPEGVPPYVVRSFLALIPMFVMVVSAWLVEWFVWSRFHITLPQLVLDLFKPLVTASNTYPAALAEIILMMLLWSLGIHGMNVVSSIAYPFWMTQLAANAEAASRGLPLPGIVTEPFFHVFTHLGGSGTTWPLTIMFLLSASMQLRTIGRAELIPAIFNINEPIIFGAPIVLNPILIIPFILAPAAVVTINYFAFALNLVPRPLIQLPFTVPVFISGFISSGGHWQGALLQLVDLIVAAIIYYPFFRMYEAQLLKNEREVEK